MEKQPWQMTRKEFSKNYEHGVAYKKTYITGYGEPIEIGEQIDLQFMGEPVKFPRPWKLVGAKNKYSTVNYKNSVELTIESATDERRTFPFAYRHSPSGKKSQEYFTKFIESPLSNDEHANLIKLALSEGEAVPAEVLKDYPELVANHIEQFYLEKYRKLAKKYPDRINEHLERAKGEKASLVLGREFGESFDSFLERRSDVKERWDELTIAIKEMEQVKAGITGHLKE